MVIGLRLAALAPLAVALAVVIVVWPGLMPGVGFWDTGEFQTVLPVLGTAHPTGYPTYVILGFLANLVLTPIGEPAFRMNVLSLICVAVAAAATTRLVMRLTGSTALGMAAGLGLAATPVVWRLATHADPHTLHLAFVALLLLALVRWEQGRAAGEATADRWLVVAAALFGLSAGNHSLTLLLALPIGLYVLAVHPGILRRPAFMAACVAALVGSVVLVYLELPIRAGVLRAPLVYAEPNTWDGFWYVALAEQFRGALVEPFGGLPAKAGALADLTVSQFGILAAFIPVGFLAAVVRHPRYALLTGTAMVITVLFNAAYSNADIQRYYLGPALWAWTWLAILAGVVVEQLAGMVSVDAGDGPAAALEPRRRAGADLGPAGAALAAGLAIALLAPTALALEDRAREADKSRDDAAQRWLDVAMATFDEDAVVVSWWSTSTVLWYGQVVAGLRPDIDIVDDRTRLDRDYGEATDVIDRFLDERPVYVIRANAYDLGLVLAEYRLAPLVPAGPASDIYRVVGRREPGG